MSKFGVIVYLVAAVVAIGAGFFGTPFDMPTMFSLGFAFLAIAIALAGQRHERLESIQRDINTMEVLTEIHEDVKHLKTASESSDSTQKLHAKLDDMSARVEKMAKKRWWHLW